MPASAIPKNTEASSDDTGSADAPVIGSAATRALASATRTAAATRAGRRTRVVDRSFPPRIYANRTIMSTESAAFYSPSG